MRCISLMSPFHCTAVKNTSPCIPSVLLPQPPCPSSTSLQRPLERLRYLLDIFSASRVSAVARAGDRGWLHEALDPEQMEPARTAHYCRTGEVCGGPGRGRAVYCGGRPHRASGLKRYQDACMVISTSSTYYYSLPMPCHAGLGFLDLWRVLRVRTASQAPAPVNDPGSSSSFKSADGDTHMHMLAPCVAAHERAAVWPLHDAPPHHPHHHGHDERDGTDGLGSGFVLVDGSGLPALPPSMRRGNHIGDHIGAGLWAGSPAPPPPPSGRGGGAAAPPERRDSIGISTRHHQAAPGSAAMTRQDSCLAGLDGSASPSRHSAQSSAMMGTLPGMLDVQAEGLPHDPLHGHHQAPAQAPMQAPVQAPVHGLLGPRADPPPVLFEARTFSSSSSSLLEARHIRSPPSTATDCGFAPLAVSTSGRDPGAGGAGRGGGRAADQGASGGGRAMHRVPSSSITAAAPERSATSLPLIRTSLVVAHSASQRRQDLSPRPLSPLSPSSPPGQGQERSSSGLRLPHRAASTTVLGTSLSRAAASVPSLASVSPFAASSPGALQAPAPAAPSQSPSLGRRGLGLERAWAALFRRSSARSMVQPAPAPAPTPAQQAWPSLAAMPSSTRPSSQPQAQGPVAESAGAACSSTRSHGADEREAAAAASYVPPRLGGMGVRSSPLLLGAGAEASETHDEVITRSAAAGGGAMTQPSTPQAAAASGHAFDWEAGRALTQHASQSQRQSSGDDVMGAISGTFLVGSQPGLGPGSAPAASMQPAASQRWQPPPPPALSPEAVATPTAAAVAAPAASSGRQELTTSTAAGGSEAGKGSMAAAAAAEPLWRRMLYPMWLRRFFAWLTRVRMRK